MWIYFSFPTHQDEGNFVAEQVENLAYDVIEAVLKEKVYSDVEVDAWIDEICSRIMEELVNQRKPFKYLINCTVSQKNGAGSHLAQSYHWVSFASSLISCSL